jgi:hypothetical protein
MHTRYMTYLGRMLELACACGVAMVTFYLLLGSYGLNAQAQPLPAPPIHTTWRMQNPDPTQWITSTDLVSAQVRVTNTLGIHADSGNYIFDPMGSPFVMTSINTQSAVLTAPGLLLAQGADNILTFTVVTSDVSDISATKAFTLLLDSIAPTATFTTPLSGSVWVSGANVFMSWLVTETASGLTATQVWFRPTSIADFVFVTSTTTTQVSWVMPETITEASSDAVVELRLMDNAGNSAIARSEPFAVEKTKTPRGFLPSVLNHYPCDNQFMDWCEPNNTISTSFPLPLDYGITATINMTPDRSDYYQLTLPIIKVYTATLKLVLPCADPTPKCDLDLYLYNSTSALVASANHGGIGNETLVFTPANTSPYYLRVYAFSTTITPTTYTLIVR